MVSKSTCSLYFTLNFSESRLINGSSIVFFIEAQIEKFRAEFCMRCTFTPALDIPTMIDASIEIIIGKDSTEWFKLGAKINI